MGGGPGGPLRSMSCQNGNGRWREGSCIHMDILAFRFQIHIMMITKTKSIEGSGAGRNEAYFLSKRSGL